jgi:transcriptional regulator with XRE-family HTH domain
VLDYQDEQILRLVCNFFKQLIISYLISRCQEYEKRIKSPNSLRQPVNASFITSNLFEMKATEKIRKFRLEKGYSQEYMAHQLDISQNAYSKLERGSTRLTLDKLEQIAGALGVSYQEIIHTGEQHAPGMDKRMNDLEAEVLLLKSMLKLLADGGRGKH